MLLMFWGWEGLYGGTLCVCVFPDTNRSGGTSFAVGDGKFRLVIRLLLLLRKSRCGP